MPTQVQHSFYHLHSLFAEQCCLHTGQGFRPKQIAGIKIFLARQFFFVMAVLRIGVMGIKIWKTAHEGIFRVLSHF